MADPGTFDSGPAGPGVPPQQGRYGTEPGGSGVADGATPGAEQARAARSAEVVAATRRTDRSPWNWLLLVPIVVPLVTALYNAKEPALLGFPRFYWLQLAFVLVGVLVTTLVYQATKDRS